MTKQGPILKSKIRAHYIMGFLPLLVICFLFLMVGLGFKQLLFFMLAYVWNFTFETPGIKRRVANRRYRFASLKVFYLAHVFFLNKKYLLSYLPPQILILSMMILTRDGNPVWSMLWSILGSLFYFLVRTVYQSRKKKQQMSEIA